MKKNISCGAHVHVSPYRYKYGLDQLKRIAYAVVVWEGFVQEILPEERRRNEYCESASELSDDLGSDIESRNEGSDEDNFDVVRRRIQNIRSRKQLVKYMQDDERYALWNFQNTLEGKSGTIEFRGGRHLRGKFRTKRWIAFVVSFISLALQDDWVRKTRVRRSDEAFTNNSFRSI